MNKNKKQQKKPNKKKTKKAKPNQNKKTKKIIHKQYDSDKPKV